MENIDGNSSRNPFKRISAFINRKKPTHEVSASQTNPKREIPQDNHIDKQSPQPPDSQVDHTQPNVVTPDPGPVTIPPENIINVAELGAAPAKSMEQKDSTLPNPTSSEITTAPSTSQAVEVVGTKAPIHPDIEEGMRKIIDEKVKQYARWGMVDSIPRLGEQFSEGVNMASAASNSDLELTEESKQALRRKMTEIVNNNLGVGLKDVIDSARSSVEIGIDPARKLERVSQQIRNIFKVAEQTGTKVSFMPEIDTKGAEDEKGNIPVIVLTEEQQVLAYAQDLLERSVLKGIEYNIKDLGKSVSLGIIKIDRFNAEVSSQIAFLHDRGFEVVDDETDIDVPNPEEAKNALIPRKINRSEIRKLRDQAIKDNLAKGVTRSIEMVGDSIKHGSVNPFSGFEPEHIGRIIDTGVRYGLVDRNLTTLTDGNIFNPDLIDTEVKKVVSGNMTEGVQVFVKSCVSDVREGNVSFLDSQDKWIELYVLIGEKYGVLVDRNILREQIRSQVTQETIQQGIGSIIRKIRGYVREGQFYMAKLQARQGDSLKQYALKNGILGNVDLSELDKYIEEVGIDLPRLESPSR